MTIPGESIGGVIIGVVLVCVSGSRVFRSRHRRAILGRVYHAIPPWPEHMGLGWIGTVTLGNVTSRGGLQIGSSQLVDHKK